MTRGIEAFEETRRLIVVAAHPDDLESMCGGAVARLIGRGVSVFSVNCTLGDIGTQDAGMARQSLAQTRLQETEVAAEVLGIERTFNLGYHDGELLPSLELRAQLARLYRETQADTLWTFDPFWAGQIHPDHRAAGQAALDAYMPSKMPLYHPEQLDREESSVAKLERIFFFSTDRDPDVVVDVTDIYERKVAACLAHVSQFPDGEKDLDWMKEIDGENGKQIGVTYAEVFKEVAVW